jgi:hypothetical protein
MPSGSECGFEQRGQQGYLQAVLSLLTDAPPAEVGTPCTCQSLTLAAMAEGWYTADTAGYGHAAFFDTLRSRGRLAK